MLKPETMGYIIEKMRGDSLTPLGTGKGVGKDVSLHPKYENCIVTFKNKYNLTALRDILLMIEDESCTVSYGKWELVVDNTKFFNRKFYYKSKLQDSGIGDIRVGNMPIYVFFTYNDDGFFNFWLGRTLTTKRGIVYDTSRCLTSSVKKFTAEDGDKFLKKVFGIRNFLEDFRTIV